MVGAAFTSGFEAVVFCASQPVAAAAPLLLHFDCFIALAASALGLNVPSVLRLQPPFGVIVRVYVSRALRLAHQQVHDAPSRQKQASAFVVQTQAVASVMFARTGLLRCQIACSGASRCAGQHAAISLVCHKGIVVFRFRSIPVVVLSGHSGVARPHRWNQVNLQAAGGGGSFTGTKHCVGVSDCVFSTLWRVCGWSHNSIFVFGLWFGLWCGGVSSDDLPRFAVG